MKKFKYFMTTVLLGFCKMTEGLHWTEMVGFGLSMIFWFTCAITFVVELINQ